MPQSGFATAKGKHATAGIYPDVFCAHHVNAAAMLARLAGASVSPSVIITREKCAAIRKEVLACSRVPENAVYLVAGAAHGDLGRARLWVRAV